MVIIQVFVQMARNAGISFGFKLHVMCFMQIRNEAHLNFSIYINEPINWIEYPS